MKCRINVGAPLTSTCMECNHSVHAHLAPSGVCVECQEMRIERMQFAVQVLTERIDNAQLDRLDMILSAWPKRMRTEWEQS